LWSPSFRLGTGYQFHMRLGLPLLLLVTVLVYSGLWSAGFVWDDIPLIVRNDALSQASLSAIFGADLWADTGAGEVASGYYRPLVLLSFAVDRFFFGLQPLGYHLHSLAWHLAAVVGLVYLLKDLVGDEAALLGGALFAVHPVQSEVVIWISARNDLMAAAFGFAALGMVWGKGRPGLSRLVGAGLLTVLAALSKETAFVLPGMLLVADLARGRRLGMALRLCPLVFGVGAVILLRVMLDVGGATVPSVDGVALLINNLHSVLGMYGAAILSPWPISSARDLSWLGLVSSGRVWLGLFFIVGMGLLAAFSPRRRVAALGLAWTVLLVGVAMVPIADKGGFGDRFLYWPMAGVAVALASSVAQLSRVWIVVLALPSMFIIHTRLPDWKHDRALWVAAMRDVPSPSNAVSLGHAFALHDRHKRAHVSFVSALATPGVDVDACMGVVGSAMRAGLTAQALRMGLWAEARGCPPEGGFHGWVAMAAAVEGEWGVARDWANRTPVDPKLRAAVVNAAIAKRDGDEGLYATLVAAWTGTTPLEPQVEALLGRGDVPAVRGWQ
jgi:hypothetical protein